VQTGPGALLPADARATLHTPVVDLPGGGRRMALGWFVDPLPGGGRILGAGGEVDSFSATLAFLEEPRLGIVVLCNRGDDSAERVIRALMEQVLPPLLRR